MPATSKGVSVSPELEGGDVTFPRPARSLLGKLSIVPLVGLAPKMP